LPDRQKTDSIWFVAETGAQSTSSGQVTPTARVLVADDDSLVRSGVRMLLDPVPDIEVVGEVADGAAAVAAARDLAPDVVLMDLRMPGFDGIDATRLISSDEFAETVGTLVRVLVLSTFGDEESVGSALRSGASGFLVKDAAARQLADAVRTVAAGGSWLDPSAAAAVIRVLQRAPDVEGSVAVALARLTGREREVLLLMAHGLTNEQISERLVVSGATVRTHVSRILMKTGVHDRSQAVVLAYQGRLAAVPPSRGDLSPET
jgi:DNA-binding NarL/FixJ family response regulator